MSKGRPSDPCWVDWSISLLVGSGTGRSPYLSCTLVSMSHFLAEGDCAGPQRPSLPARPQNSPLLNLEKSLFLKCPRSWNPKNQKQMNHGCAQKTICCVKDLRNNNEQPSFVSVLCGTAGTFAHVQPLYKLHRKNPRSFQHITSKTTLHSGRSLHSMFFIITSSDALCS